MKKAAVISSPGLGDGLLMMIASHRLLTEGYEVVTFNDHLNGLQNWFPDHTFAVCPNEEELEEKLKGFDLVVFQNYHSSWSEKLLDAHHRGKIQTLSIFYANYSLSRHSPLTSWDRVFDSKISMCDNISKSISTLLNLQNTSKNNGLIIPVHLSHRKYTSRVAIHPTSTVRERTWYRGKFLKLFDALKEKGFDPYFCLSPKEKLNWNHPQALSFDSLGDLASFLYESAFFIGNESGPGHLASNLYIPTLIIAGHAKRIRQWRPGWLQGRVLAPPSWIPNLKGCRLRENHWQKLISVKRVLKAFEKL